MKNWFKKTWNWLLGKTTVDEKIVEVAKEVKAEIKQVSARAQKVVKEVSNDVAEKAAPKKKRYYPKKKAAPKAQPTTTAKKPAAKKQ